MEDTALVDKVAAFLAAAENPDDPLSCESFDSLARKLLHLVLGPDETDGKGNE